MGAFSVESVFAGEPCRSDGARVLWLGDFRPVSEIPPPGSSTAAPPARTPTARSSSSTRSARSSAPDTATWRSSTRLSSTRARCGPPASPSPSCPPPTRRSSQRRSSKRRAHKKAAHPTDPQPALPRSVRKPGTATVCRGRSTAPAPGFRGGVRTPRNSDHLDMRDDRRRPDLLGRRVNPVAGHARAAVDVPRAGRTRDGAAEVAGPRPTVDATRSPARRPRCTHTACRRSIRDCSPMSRLGSTPPKVDQ